MILKLNPITLGLQQALYAVVVPRGFGIPVVKELEFKDLAQPFGNNLWIQRTVKSESVKGGTASNSSRIDVTVNEDNTITINESGDYQIQYTVAK